MSLLGRLRKSRLLYGMLSALRSHLGRGFMGCCHALFGIRRDKVVFSCFSGASYGDNTRAVSEALMRMRPGLAIVWQLARNAAGRDEVPAGVRIVRPRSLRILFHLATARVLVDNVNRPVYMKKYPDQVYIQLWHGDRAMKKILLDMNDGIDYPDARYMDLGVSGSRFGTELFRSAFGYTGEMLQVGCPRNDILLDPPEGAREKVRARLGLPEGARVLLYAPTFRNDSMGRAQKANLDLQQAVARLEEATGQKWVALMRSHVLNRGLEGAGALDVSGYPDMAPLLLIADLLITDYSSSAGDIVLRDAPVILYQPDRSAYQAKDRAFYYDLDETPYWIARNEQELYAFFAKLDQAPENCHALRAYYGMTETGHASRTVAERILQAVDEKPRR